MLTNHEAAAKLAAYAEMCDFPCSKQELLQMANEQQFPDDILDVLEELPNAVYADEGAVVEAAQTITQVRYISES